MEAPLVNTGMDIVAVVLVGAALLVAVVIIEVVDILDEEVYEEAEADEEALPEAEGVINVEMIPFPLMGYIRLRVRKGIPAIRHRCKRAWRWGKQRMQTFGRRSLWCLNIPMPSDPRDIESRLAYCCRKSKGQ